MTKLDELRADMADCLACGWPTGHIAPQTVLALLDVIEAARSMREAYRLDGQSAPTEFDAVLARLEGEGR
jgi:hypothetical protein